MLLPSASLRCPTLALVPPLGATATAQLGRSHRCGGGEGWELHLCRRRRGKTLALPHCSTRPLGGESGQAGRRANRRRLEASALHGGATAATSAVAASAA
ncbi:unnamed protein product [Lampetra fluviatilis]